MKKMRKIFALLIAMVMVLSMSTVAFAEPDAVPEAGTGTITINYAGIGETYKVYKVLDASVGANGAIVYPGPVPDGLGECFELSADGVNLQVKAGLTDDKLFEKLKTWAATATEAATITADSATVVFENLAFGYYVIVSTMDNGAVISVTSTNPNAVTYEKNITVPRPEKTVDDASYSIGDTITYTVTFPGANYMQQDGNLGQGAKIVTKYEVKDTLPEFLSNATVTKVTVGGTDITSTLNVSGFATEKKFDIPWADGNDTDGYTSKYPNGAEVKITYTAVLTSIVNVNANNTNTVTITPYVFDDENDEQEPWKESWSDSEKITTYAAALLKVDGSTPAKPLAGAKFKFEGLVVEETADGVYTVVSFNPESTELGTEMEVDANGKLYIVGLKADVNLVGKETEAPAGYNLLTEEITLSPQVMEEEIYKANGERKYDAYGNLIEATATAVSTKSVERNLEDLDEAAIKVVNNAGTLLPSTGGMGTTILYVVGGILVVAAVVLLFVKRRVEEN